MLTIHQFPVLSDNYAFLVRDEETSEVATIDTPDGPAILSEAQKRGWAITQIWNTHWHPDHAGGNAAIIAATGAKVSGPEEVSRIAPMPDTVLRGGEQITIGASQAQVIDVGGHTLNHIAYFFPQDRVAFVGDSLFTLGCGRLFEGTPEQMWASLSRLADLPGETAVYCAHEYTEANLRFALSVSTLPALKERGEHILAQRARGEATVPTSIALERATNPFLQAGDAARFATLRAAKDVFKG
jgi:hydroxyacylglutathione hydrolase